MANLERLLPLAHFIHISGQGEWDEVRAERARLMEALQARYHVYPYLHAEMGAALRAADLVVSRSGASTLGELPLFGAPSILVPYPYAWRYQKVNAEFLAGRGAAVIVRDEDAPRALAPAIERLRLPPVRSLPRLSLGTGNGSSCPTADPQRSLNFTTGARCHRGYAQCEPRLSAKNRRT